MLGALYHILKKLNNEEKHSSHATQATFYEVSIAWAVRGSATNSPGNTTGDFRGKVNMNRSMRETMVR